MSIRPSARFGVSDEYWNRITEKDRQLYEEIRPLRKATYSVQSRILRIEEALADLDRDAQMQGGRLELQPDFQRGHVWTPEKQVAFMESVVRGVAPMVIRFNCPGWDGSKPEGVEGLDPYTIQCIDGLQRLTAMREFVAGNIKVFGGKYGVEDLNDTAFSFARMGANWTMEVFNIASRADLLQFYLDLNSGGVVHTPEELSRVGGLLDEARASSSKPSTGKGPKR